VNNQNATRRHSGGNNRRDFIKTSSAVAVAGAASTSGLFPRQSLARSVHVAGTDTIQIGLIGCGGRGTQAAQQAMNTQSGPVMLTEVADVFSNRLDSSLESMKRNMKERFDEQVLVEEENKHLGFDAFERVMESDCDMVILATPPGFRPLHFEKAIEAGKHVFMEKPVATDAPGVRRILAANEKAKQKGLAVAVGLQRRHERAYMETIDQLQQGAIGDIQLMRAYWNGNTPWVRTRQADETELEYQMKNWYFFNWICGDHIVEQHIHNLDVINWLKDGYPVKAQGQGGRLLRNGRDHGQIYDHHFVEFTYADGSTMLSQCRHMPNTWTQVNEFATGTQGDCNIGRGIIRVGGKDVFRTEGSRGGHQQEHHDLFAELRDGRIPNEGVYGALSTMTAIFGRMATYSGREITWQEALESKLKLADVDSLTSFDSEPPLRPDENGNYFIPKPDRNIDGIL